MKFIILTTFLHFFLNSSALPLKMLQSFNQRHLPLTHNLMYVEYRQPQQSGGVQSYTNGQLLGTATYSKDCTEDKITDAKIDVNPYESFDPLRDSGFDANTDDGSDKTYVEQYPQTEYHQTGSLQPQYSEVSTKEEIDETGNVNTELPQIGTTPFSDEGSNDKKLVPTSVLNSEAYLPPRKRVYVDLEYPLVDSGYQNTDYFHHKKLSKPDTAHINDKAGLPIGSYFPLHFGESSGSTIAVANSFSTGSGGSAVSHAIAYGNPNSGNGNKKDHNVPSKF